ncbi:MAG: glycosyltransferase [Lewinella sp.]
MKVLFLSAWWPNRLLPTHGNFIEKHARLIAIKHQVTVVAIQEDTSLPVGQKNVRQRVRDNYREIIVYFGRSPNKRGLRLLVDRFKAYRAGIKLATRLDGVPQIIHGNIILDAGVVSAWYALRLGVPYVISEHATRYTRPVKLSWLRRRLSKWVCRRAYAILPVSAQLAHSMRSLHGLKGEYITVSNVVNDRLFQPAIHRGVTSPLRLLHVSSFNDRNKNITGLLCAYRDLSDRNPGAYSLHLAGDGNLDDVKRWIAEVDLPEAEVTVSGPYTEIGVASLMQKHDAFVLFSNVETQGVVLLEAMISGIPCVATRVGGVEDAIDEGFSGYLVEAGDQYGLVQALERLRKNYATFDSAAIRLQAVKRHGESGVSEKLSSIYYAAIGQPIRPK